MDRINAYGLFLMLMFSLTLTGCGGGGGGGSNTQTNCTNVWPRDITSKTSSKLVLPAFTGKNKLKLSASFGKGTFHIGKSKWDKGTLTTTGGATTILLVNGDLEIKDKAKINPGGKPEDLLIIVKGKVKIKDKAQVNALIYATDKIEIKDKAQVRGAVTSEKDAKLKDKAKIHYDANAPDKVNAPGFCKSNPGTSSLNNFNISVPGTTSTCSTNGAQITITARDSNNNTLTNYTGTVTLTTSSNHGDWAKFNAKGTLSNGTADNGQATYTYHTNDQGIASFYLKNTHADQLTITVTDSNASISSTSSALQFSDNALEIHQTNADPLGWDVIAGRDHTFKIRYHQKDPSSGNCAVPDFDGAATIKIYRINGGSHPAGAAAPFIGSSSNSIGTTKGTAASTSITFTNGEGSFVMSNRDVGQYSLVAFDDSGTFVVDQNGDALEVSGSSTQTFAVRPFGFYVSAQTTSGTANPQPADHNGNAFVKAGEAFRVNVVAVGYDSADDQMDNQGNPTPDGLPDGYWNAGGNEDTNPTNNADLSDNNGKYVPALSLSYNESTTLTANLYLPAGGQSPTLRTSASSQGSPTAPTITAFAAGSGNTSDVVFDEVGIIEITAKPSDDDYLGSVSKVWGKTRQVGRFIPSYFSWDSASAPTLTDGWYDGNGDNSNDWSCNFTYQEQTFGLTTDPSFVLTAKNQGNNTTQNYTGNFNKLVSTGYANSNIQIVDNGKPSLPVAATASLSAPTDQTITATDNAGTPGEFTVTVSGYADTPYEWTYTKSAAPNAGDAPFSADFSIYIPDNTGNNFVDSDNVCVDSVKGGTNFTSCAPLSITNITGTQIRYARLAINNGFAQAAYPIFMPYQAEQFNGTHFQVNTDDSCSVFATGNFQPDDYQINGGIAKSAVSLSLSNNGLVNGKDTLQITKSSSSSTGFIDIEIISYPKWFKYDYDGDGNLDVIDTDADDNDSVANRNDGPTARATWGVPGDRAPVLQLQQTYR